MRFFALFDYAGLAKDTFFCKTVNIFFYFLITEKNEALQTVDYTCSNSGQNDFGGVKFAVFSARGRN